MLDSQRYPLNLKLINDKLDISSCLAKNFIIIDPFCNSDKGVKGDCDYESLTGDFLKNYIPFS